MNKWLIIGGLVALGTLGGGAAIVLVSALGAGKDKAKFSREMFKVVSATLPSLPVASRVIIVAHAAYESGWGQLGNARANTNNVFNITAGSAWTGPVAQGSDTDGAGKPITQRWRAYPSLNAAVADYWKFLGSTRYLAARSELLNPSVSISAFTSLLRQGGYFTLDLATYTAQLKSIARDVASAVGVNVSIN